LHRCKYANSSHFHDYILYNKMQRIIAQIVIKIEYEKKLKNEKNKKMNRKTDGTLVLFMCGYTAPPFAHQDVHRIRILDIQRNYQKVNEKYEQKRIQFQVSTHFNSMLLMFLYISLTNCQIPLT